MNRIILVGAVAFLLCACGAASGDGMLLLPSQLFLLYTEQSQLAVIEVNADRTVRVDLFISLLDTSGKPHEVRFILPLQTMPTEFQAQDVTGGQFREAHLAPLDRIFRAREEAKQRDELHRDAASMAGATIAGPVALVIDAGYSLRPMFGARKAASIGPGVGPAISVETTHSRVDVYRALRPEELATLAGGELSETVRKAISAYAGRPFALVRLRMVPRGRTAGVQGRPEEPGVHFTFTQEMLRDGDHYRYDFPLGTGQGWANPIGAIEVCVTGGTALHLKPVFPGTPYVAAEAAGDRQVHMASYDQQNPGRDVRVELLLSGKSECVAERDAGHLWVVLSYVGFPPIGALAWLLAVRLTLWRPGSRGERSFWRLAAISGLHLWYPALAFLTAFAGLAFLLSLTTPWWPAFLAVLALIGAGAILAWRMASRYPLPGGPARLWALAVVSGLLYFGARLAVAAMART